jgi:hypothetical protein
MQIISHKRKYQKIVHITSEVETQIKNENRTNSYKFTNITSKPTYNLLVHTNKHNKIK